MKLMIIDENNLKGKIIAVNKCQKPKFSCRNGKTWDSISREINGNSVKFRLDTTWGRYMYFEYELQWYKVAILHNETKEIGSNVFDIYSDAKKFEIIKE